MKKINVLNILSEHFKTLKNDNDDKYEIGDILTFILLPVVAASILTFYEIELKETSTNIIITTLSILVGLLFNVIVIIFDIVKRDASVKLKNELLHQLLTNIAYSILSSIVIIAFTLISLSTNCIVSLISTWLVYALIGNYFLTVLMILKRMYLLFDNELKEISKKEDSTKQ